MAGQAAVTKYGTPATAPQENACRTAAGFRTPRGPGGRRDRTGVSYPHCPIIRAGRKRIGRRDLSIMLSATAGRRDPTDPCGTPATVILGRASAAGFRHRARAARDAVIGTGDDVEPRCPIIRAGRTRIRTGAILKYLQHQAGTGAETTRKVSMLDTSLECDSAGRLSQSRCRPILGVLGGRHDGRSRSRRRNRCGRSHRHAGSAGSGRQYRATRFTGRTRPTRCRRSDRRCGSLERLDRHRRRDRPPGGTSRASPRRVPWPATGTSRSRRHRGRGGDRPRRDVQWTCAMRLPCPIKGPGLIARLVHPSGIEGLILAHGPRYPARGLPA
jgi:hypothetical protein